MTAAPLGVVVPVYNEPHWILRSVAALRVAAERAGIPLDIVIVDDGSTDDTPQVLDAMAHAAPDLRVIHQPNGGRFAARARGVAAMTADDVLLLDSRVLAHPDALRHMDDVRHRDPSKRVWNAHIVTATAGNPYGAFWSGLAKVFWRRYHRDERPVSYGLAEFDAYPKGTTAFLAPRAALTAAIGRFDSMFTDSRLMSDDTRLIREIAASEDITLDPGFAFDYHGRTSFPGWLRQCYYRGTTFVDGYLHDRRRAPAALGALGVGAVAVAAAAVRRPWLVAAGITAGLWAVGRAVRACGGTPDEIRGVRRLAVPFSAVFGAGLVRGLLMAMRGR